jgi:phage tail sheath protein FI
MPVAPTYPGVYIEELPSGVHTITGVSTSIAAFVGFTAKGAVDEAVHIFSFADFERSFGGLAVDSPLSYCVKHFFQNGGTEAYVVRVAQGAAAASVTLRNGSTANDADVLIVTAASPGRWGNGLQIEVDYDTVNPSSRFNLRVTEYVERNGELVPGTTEPYRNLTMNSFDPNFVLNVINAASQLISVSLPPALVISGRGSSQSAPLTVQDLQQFDTSHNRLAFRLNGQPPQEVVLNTAVAANAGAVATEIVRAINAAAGGTPVELVPGAPPRVIAIRTSVPSERASIQLMNAGTANACSVLKLGVANGGIEIDGAAGSRAMSTGTVGSPAVATVTGGVAAVAGLNAATANKLRVSLNGGAPFEITVDVPLADAAAAATNVASKINAVAGFTAVEGSAAGTAIVITAVDPARCWSIHVADGVQNGAGTALQLGLPNVGLEVPALAARSTSGTVVASDFGQLGPAHSMLAVSINGRGYSIAFDLTNMPANLAAVPGAIEGLINTQVGTSAVVGTLSGNAPNQNIVIASRDPLRWASIHFASAPASDAAAILKLGYANGGTEDALTLDVRSGSSGASLRTIQLPLWNFWGVPKPAPQPRSIDDVADDIDQALKGLASSEPYLVGASARRIGNTIRVVPGSTGVNSPNTSFDFSGANATVLGLTAANRRNVARYAPGTGLTALAQVQGASGNDGAAPTATELLGNQLSKTGLYALEDVDIFNLLVMPDATAAGGMMGVLTEAIAYCVRRRAFMIIDAPEQIATFAQAQAWISGPASPLRSRNDALYFPRLREPDPMMNGAVRTFPAAGAMAGIYARTDAERGVWKAPAGTMATVWGATGLSYTMTDAENGTFNPRGLNCLRTFPIVGTVSWGARTGNGADALADEYKYVPVRRLALFLEESLYRGSQWAVFEPNDEPLWAQLRLNIGAFMHTLFTQGAFQGQTPRDAYFVKCDKETTTQNDVDLGRVNIVVGFAPLKPAEFVVIQIQQIAGAIRT